MATITRPPKTKILILQHPQEPDKELGTARLILSAIPEARLKVGLSWPNFTKAWGEAAEPGTWGVFFLGGKQESGAKIDHRPGHEVYVLDKQGKPIEQPLMGVVLLDGNWRQAKALWWRNPWLLKLKRIVLRPKAPSLYGNLRKEPRRESISTLEALAIYLGEKEGLEYRDGLIAPFQEMLAEYRARQLSEKR